MCKQIRISAITVTNSNSSPEVNSSEVSLKSQCEFRVCTQKHPKHLLGGGAYVFIYKFVPLKNSHSKDELQSSLQWSFKLQFFFFPWVRSDHSKDELQSLQWSFMLRIFSRVWPVCVTSGWWEESVSDTWDGKFCHMIQPMCCSGYWLDNSSSTCLFSSFKFTERLSVGKKLTFHCHGLPTIEHEHIAPAGLCI